ncbi:MAG: RsmD family RNA methyltransferase [Planctomycetota bacterium]|jgi:16S rRNA (guanine(966)-N(2))-methyltransferase RsmD
MRIIAGTKRAMKLAGPKSDASRPILDRVKESLFSVLYKYDLPEGKMVADLFSGVGSLGIEALSRAAEFVMFVEKDPAVVAILNANIKKAGFIKASKVIKANAFKIGAPVDFDDRKYDLVFVDPPYSLTADIAEDSVLGRLLLLLPEQLAPEGIVVVRTHKHTELLDRYGRLEVIELRKWGNMAIAILRNRIDDE